MEMKRKSITICSKILTLSIIAILVLIACKPENDSSSGSNSNVEEAENMFIVENFGAVGDGVADDGKSIGNAIKEATNYLAANPDKDAVVKLGKDKTYYMDSLTLTSVNSNYALVINDTKNLSIVGDNTIIKVKPGRQYLAISSCENITVSGINFDYATKAVVKSKVIATNFDDNTVDIQAPFEFDFEGDFWEPTEVAGNALFGIPVALGRNHSYFSKYERLSEENTYRIYFTVGGFSMLKQGMEFYTPVPNSAYSTGEVFSIWHSSNVKMENCNIWSAPSFIFNIRMNKGDIQFKNVNIAPSIDDNSETIAWRDGFHCKDNRGRLIFEDCNLMGMQDDVFNISATQLTITKVESPTEFTMACQEYDGQYAELQVGDELTIVDINNGKLLANTTITKVIKQFGSVNTIEIAEPVEGLDGEMIRVMVDSLAAPNSIVKNCTVSGTVRFRGKITVENTTFSLLQMWLENEVEFEGPVPKDIIFKNCIFKRIIPSNNAIIAVTTTMKRSGSPEYKCKNIMFESCEIEESMVSVSAGNEVIFR